MRPARCLTFTLTLSKISTVATPAEAKTDRTWTVGELADDLGVTTRTLRFYEAEGLISPSRVGTSRIYSPRERAALAWAESLTQIAKTHAPDAVYEDVRGLFSEDELLTLSIGVAMINAWNRLAIGFRQQHPADRRRDATPVAAQ